MFDRIYIAISAPRLRGAGRGDIEKMQRKNKAIFMGDFYVVIVLSAQIK